MTAKVVTVVAGRRWNNGAWEGDPTSLGGDWMKLPRCKVRMTATVIAITTAVDGAVAAKLQLRCLAKQASGETAVVAALSPLSVRDSSAEHTLSVADAAELLLEVVLENARPELYTVVFAQVAVSGNVIPLDA